MLKCYIVDVLLDKGDKIWSDRSEALFMYKLAERFPCTITKLLLPVALMAPHTITIRL